MGGCERRRLAHAVEEEDLVCWGDEKDGGAG